MHSFRYIFSTFFKLGLVSFGGYMALVSVVHARLVERDKILPGGILADLIALASVLPGPVAVNIVSAVGYHLRGWRGMLAAFIGILTPAFLFMWILFILYERFIDMAVMSAFFRGASGVIIAIILSMGYSMAKKETWKISLYSIAPVIFIILMFLHSYWHLLTVLLLSGAIGWYFRRDQYKSVHENRRVAWVLPSLIALAAFIYFIPDDTIYFDLASTFSSVSLSLFGGGYVMIPLLQDIVVTKKAWLTQQEFIDSIALGQITPGPILISSAFVGFKQAGFAGGLIATLASFAPSSIVMVVLYEYVKGLLGNRHVKAFFDGLRIAVIAMIFYSAVALLVMNGVGFIILFNSIIALFLLIFARVNPIYAIIGGGVLGIIGYLVEIKI